MYTRLADDRVSLLLSLCSLLRTSASKALGPSGPRAPRSAAKVLASGDVALLLELAEQQQVSSGLAGSTTWKFFLLANARGRTARERHRLVPLGRDVAARSSSSPPPPPLLHRRLLLRLRRLLRPRHRRRRRRRRPPHPGRRCAAPAGSVHASQSRARAAEEVRGPSAARRRRRSRGGRPPRASPTRAGWRARR